MAKESMPHGYSGCRSKIDPLIIALAPLSRNTTLAATSAGRRILPRGTDESAFFHHSSSLCTLLCNLCSFSVKVQPMFTPFTLIPCGASSAALFFVSVTNADLAQE